MRCATSRTVISNAPPIPPVGSILRFFSSCVEDRPITGIGFAVTANTRQGDRAKRGSAFVRPAQRPSFGPFALSSFRGPFRSPALGQRVAEFPGSVAASGPARTKAGVHASPQETAQPPGITRRRRKHSPRLPRSPRADGLPPQIVPAGRQSASAEVGHRRTGRRPVLRQTGSRSHGGAHPATTLFKTSQSQYPP